MPQVNAELKAGGGKAVGAADGSYQAWMSALHPSQPAFWSASYVVLAVLFLLGCHWGFRGGVSS